MFCRSVIFCLLNCVIETVLQIISSRVTWTSTHRRAT